MNTPSSSVSAAPKARPLASLRYRIYQWTERFGDWRLGGVDTRGLVVPDDFGAGGDGCHAYLGLSYPGLHRVLRHAPVQPGRDVFIDIGSGLGRVVFQAAASLPLKRAIGVEFSPSLHVRAQTNLALALPRLRCKQVSLHQADARRYEIPDDATIIFFFMPFGPQILGPVLDNIRQSLRRAPRELTILYAYPTDGAVPLHIMQPERPWLRVEPERAISSGLRLAVARIDPDA
jgi:hypothetical protein